MKIKNIKKIRKASFAIMLLELLLLASNKARAQFAKPLYGVPSPEPTSEIILRIALIIFLPLAIIIGVIIYIAKKTKEKQNTKNISNIKSNENQKN